MPRPVADVGGASSFENVREFLRYVEGDPVQVDRIPPGIGSDLEELGRRATAARALTGVMAPVELSPYVLELLKAVGSEGPVAGEGVLKAARA